MKIVILNGGPRKNGNTEIMVDKFIEYATEAGHECTKYNLGQMKISPCLGCRSCLDNGGVCVQHDDMEHIVSSIENAEMLVFASPCYFFGIFAQLCTAINRMYVFSKRGYKITKAALLMQGGAPDYESFVAPIVQYNIMCKVHGWKDMGIITINKMRSKGSMADCPELEQIKPLVSRL